MAGSVVQVRVRAGVLHVHKNGEVLASLALRARSGEIVTHPEQWGGGGTSPGCSLRSLLPLAVGDGGTSCW